MLIEPVRGSFEQLKKNYHGVPGVIFENAAITNFIGTTKIHCLKVDPEEFGYDKNLTQLSSLDKDHSKKFFTTEEEKEVADFYYKNLTEEKVDCLTFDELVKKHEISNIDLLQIDTEGHEYEILKTINFNEHNIRFINYEHQHLGIDKDNCLNYLKSFDYLHERYKEETLCYKETDHCLSQRWH